MTIEAKQADQTLKHITEAQAGHIDQGDKNKPGSPSTTATPSAEEKNSATILVKVQAGTTK